MTDNSGQKWQDIRGALMDIPVNDVVVDPDVAKKLYVATDIGVFVTTNLGTKWSVLGDKSLPRVAVFGLKLHRITRNSRTLRAGTHGRSAWDLDVSLPRDMPTGIELFPANLTFGSQPIGVASVSQAVVLKNSGEFPLTTYGTWTSAPFVHTSTCGQRLDPGESCTITNRDVAGARNAMTNVV